MALDPVFRALLDMPGMQFTTPPPEVTPAMMREIAELHRGTVSVRSDAGRGSTFTLRLPRTEANIKTPPGDGA